MPDDGIQRELGSIASTLKSMADLHKQHELDVEGLQKRAGDAELDRATMKEAMSGIMERVMALAKESKEQSVAINLKLDALQAGFNRLAARPQLSDEARQWVHEQHGQHMLRRETDLQVTRARATAWTWPAVVTLIFGFVTVGVLIATLVHH